MLSTSSASSPGHPRHLWLVPPAVASLAGDQPEGMRRQIPFSVEDLMDLASGHQSTPMPTGGSDPTSKRGEPQDYLILVVDDDPTIRDLVSLALELHGFRVVAARNGAEALARLEAHRPDLVLLDMRMPVMDGWAFAAEVRHRGIPLKIAVMTATTDVRRWGEEIGADACLGKPFEIEQLLGVVEGLCRAA